uniref:Uncharacterized protein n=1 Tax=Rhizophora mucronata TaxID=61149 RepID=A0A2P2LL92_RHIMU
MENEHNFLHSLLCSHYRVHCNHMDSTIFTKKWKWIQHDALDFLCYTFQPLQLSSISNSHFHRKQMQSMASQCLTDKV